MDHPLDNPVWYSLIGAHAPVAVGRGLARQYPRDVVPFAAIAEPTAAAYRDLAQDLPEGLEARLFRPAPESLPEGWEEISARPILQMVLGRAVAAGSAAVADQRIRRLGPEDAVGMLELAAAAKPGPFERRTSELGAFIGVLADDRLIAMAGERFRVPGYVELSAIAVHPGARGRGLASVLMAHLIGSAAQRGETPFLHVFPDSPAVSLYKRLGFRTRAELRVLWRRPSRKR